MSLFDRIRRLFGFRPTEQPPQLARDTIPEKESANKQQGVDKPIIDVSQKLPTTIKCSCGRDLKASGRLAGKKAKCRECGQTFSFAESKVKEQPSLPASKVSARRATGIAQKHLGQEMKAQERPPKRAQVFRVSGERLAFQRQRVQLVVGLDFGTSTCKCVARAQIERPHQQPKIHEHVHSIDGEVLFPSVLWQTGSRISLGKRPAESDSRALRSAKVCLRCMVLQNERCCRCKNGRYDWTQLNAEVASWAIVSYGVGQIRQQLSAMYPPTAYELDWNRVEWKMGVPLDGLEEEPLWRLFADILWRAVHHGHAVRNGMSVEELWKSYLDLDHEHCPPPEVSNCFIQPEAVVAVNAFLRCYKHGRLPPGLYYICDIGAGTLDVAFFRFSPASERAIVCYETSCTRVGGDSFAEIMARYLTRSQESPGFSDCLEKALADMANGARDVHAFLSSPRDAQSQNEVDETHRQVRIGRNRAFDRSRRKEMSWSNWKGVQALIIGGARDLPGVQRALTWPISYGHPDETIYPRGAPCDVPEIDGMTELHRIAYGLSIPMAEYYDYWLPSDVEVLELPRQRVRPIGEDPYRTTG